MLQEEISSSKNIVLRGMILTLACLFLSLLPWARIFSVSTDDVSSKTLFFFISRMYFWITLGITYLYVQKIEKQKFFIWTEEKYNFGIYVAFFFALLGILIIGLLFISLTLKLLHLYSVSGKMNQLMVIFKEYRGLMIFTALTAGVIEELLFRGYLMPRLQQLYNNKYITIGVSSFLFGMLHFGYGTIINVVAPMFIGFIFALHYQKFRNIKILIFTHFMWDMIALMLKAR